MHTPRKGSVDSSYGVDRFDDLHSLLSRYSYYFLRHRFASAYVQTFKYYKMIKEHEEAERYKFLPRYVKLAFHKSNNN